MMPRLIHTLAFAVLLGTTATLPTHALAHHDGSALSALSALPVASIVVGGSATASAAVAIPAMLSVAGAVLVVKAIETGVRGSVIVLERASDGARASIAIAGSGIAATSLVVGSVVTVSAIGAGVVLSAAGEAIAFIPNTLGNALLHDERITY